MLPEATPAVLRAIGLAQSWAANLGCDLSSRLLLLALAMEEEGRPATLLHEQGLSRRLLHQELGDEMSPSLLSSAEAAPLPAPAAVSPLAETLTFAARRIANELCGESVVASEHLLIAVLQHDAELRERLEPHGLSLGNLEERLRPAPIALDEPLTLLEPTDKIDTARILDANANRAREALRTIEDYCRFVLDDATLSGELKRLRHDLAEALGIIGLDVLLEARETQRDVGTTLTTPTEERRVSPVAVAQAACKRLQEALRCLEEYGKLHNTDLGRAIEAVRYRSYTLERAILLGSTARQRLAEARLYVLVTGSLCVASLEWTIQEAIAGGAQIIQLREKQLNDRELLERARAVRRWTRAGGALFIMNDRPDIARLVEADGVHVGQEELGVKEVRRIVGPQLLIGVSTHDAAQVRQAVLDGASYVGVGPTFPSATKQFDGFAGLAFIREAAALTTLPAFAIGGINLDNVDQVVSAGLRRIAVSHAICQAEDPREAAARLRRVLDGGT